MATNDARISTAFPSHPKTKKLGRRLGPAGPLTCIYLFLWTAENRSDGDLSGLSDEDIELAVNWTGEDGQFIAAMLAVGFLEGEEGSRQIHDWIEHNPWAAGAKARSDKARWAALCMRHGRDEAARLMPDYARRKGFDSQEPAKSEQSASSELSADELDAELLARFSSAPSPSPSPKQDQDQKLPTSSAQQAAPAEHPPAEPAHHGNGPPIDGVHADPDPIFGHGLAFLLAKGVRERGARSFLGAMRKELGELATAELLAIAEREDVSDPVAWLRKAGDARRNLARDGPPRNGHAAHAPQFPTSKTGAAILALQRIANGSHDENDAPQLALDGGFARLPAVDSSRA